MAAQLTFKFEFTRNVDCVKIFFMDTAYSGAVYDSVGLLRKLLSSAAQGGDTFAQAAIHLLKPSNNELLPPLFSLLISNLPKHHQSTFDTLLCKCPF